MGYNQDFFQLQVGYNQSFISHKGVAKGILVQSELWLRFCCYKRVTTDKTMFTRCEKYKIHERS
jgi:hypothetical protein